MKIICKPKHNSSSIPLEPCMGARNTPPCEPRTKHDKTTERINHVKTTPKEGEDDGI